VNFDGYVLFLRAGNFGGDHVLVVVLGNVDRGHELRSLRDRRPTSPHQPRQPEGLAKEIELIEGLDSRQSTCCFTFDHR
jgi:hypothetical protein